jgi:predicted deacylase
MIRSILFAALSTGGFAALSTHGLYAADLTVGTATAAAGRKATGALQIAAGVDAAASVPVIVVNGAKPGPVLALVSGSHGTEYASIIAVAKLAQSLDAAAISGSVILLPLVNVASFQEKVPHVNPVDRKNMNRFYPGKPDGTQTERISWAIAQQVVQKSDYLLDYHGGDLDENLAKYSYWPDTGNSRIAAATRAMVLAFGLDHIIIQNARNPVPPGGAVTLTRYAQNLGKPAIPVEAGHAGTVHAEDVDALVNGTLSVMRELKMLAGAPKPVEHPLWLGPITTVAADQDGIFFPLVAPETYVRQGMAIGYLTNYYGERIREVTAPLSGVVAYIGAVPSMKKGDTVANIAALADDPQH